MKKIVLLRHGESAWNKENRFTGWTDVDLTEKGVAEAVRAGELLAEKGFRFKKAYTSYLKRAVKTLDCVLDRLDQDWIPVEKSWRLNEKHYGQLQGLNKAETAAKYGDEQVLVWRRSFDVAPHALAEDDPRNPRFEDRFFNGHKWKYSGILSHNTTRPPGGHSSSSPQQVSCSPRNSTGNRPYGQNAP